MNKKAFSLVEMLVVLAIIGLVAAAASVSATAFRQKSRDTQRLNDAKEIQAALELYRMNEGGYPTALSFGQPLVGSSSTSTVYVAHVPNNPVITNTTTCTSSNYRYGLDDKGRYQLLFCLERGDNSLDAGYHCATPTGFVSNCWFCGDPISYGGESYPTVLIGNQCWFAKNLNVGAMVTGLTEQSNDTILEKYCYDDNENNCTNDGGLYQLNEAMQYSSSEGARGICPPAWHIPTDTEQNTLDQFLSSTSCDSNRSGTWDCANAGAELQVGGSSGFESLLAGYRSPDGSFNDNNIYDYFWSSSISGPGAFARGLYSGLLTVTRGPGYGDFGFSIRCLRNY